jgi:tRNA(Ile)-lysidine synthase
MSNDAIARVTAAARAGEALSGDGPPLKVLAMLSGGADSVCLLHVAIELLGAERVQVLHVNHGLRPAAADEERFCADMCRAIGVELHIERLSSLGAGGAGEGGGTPRGNLEAHSRDARYEAAERVRAAAGLDLIATGHTASDQVETILYRLVSSPGRRALLGMQPRRGRLVRPLLSVSHEDTCAYCTEAGLGWREDESNSDRRLARNLLRLEVLPLLREINAGADRNVLATAAELRDEAGMLDQAVEEALRRTGAGGAPPAVDAARLAAEPSPVRRLVLRRLAETAAGATVALRPEDASTIERLAERGGSGAVDLGGGLRAIVEYGFVRFGRQPEEAAPPAPVTLPVPGSCRFGEWEVVSAQSPARPGADLGSADEPRLDADKLAGTLTVRAWRDGDRIQPLGLDGTKSLQDLFGDRKVPRSLRRSLPVVESDGEIAWVAGVAVSERFRVRPGTRATVRLGAARRL